MPFGFKSLYPSLFSLFVHGTTPQPQLRSQLLHTCTALYKGNTQRTRVAAPGTDSGVGSKSSARRDSAKQMSASSNRNKWEDNNKLCQQLIGKHPNTNVYFAPEFETRYWDFPASILALREAAQPDMYDCMENPLRAKFTLNMRTKKKTKFIQKVEGDTVLPNLLDFLPKRQVIALCKDENEANDCLQAGAFEAGGAELFARLKHGVFHWDEYDGVVASSTWESTISQLRNLLKDRLPTIKNGWLDPDVVRMVTSFINGVHLESVPLDGVPEIAYLDVVVGQLSWDIDKLTENLQHYFNTLFGLSSSRVVGDVVQTVDLSCPPTGELFPLDLATFLSKVPRSTTQVKATTAPGEEQAADAQTSEAPSVHSALYSGEGQSVQSSGLNV